HLPVRLAGKEVSYRDHGDFANDRGEALSRFGLAELREISLEDIEALDRIGIVFGSIKKSDELGVLLARFGIEGQYLDEPTRGLDLGSLLIEQLPRAFPVRKQIRTVAQQSRARRLQRAPDAHPQGGVGPREIGDEEQPGWRWGWHCSACYLI